MKMQKPSTAGRIHVTISPALKDRLATYAKETGRNQGDLIEEALLDYFETLQRTKSAPDLVLDRLNQNTLALMHQVRETEQLKDQIKSMELTLEAVLNK